MSKTLWIIIIVILVGAGAFIYSRYGGFEQQAVAPYTQPQAEVRPDEALQAEADLNAVQTDGLDAELTDIEKEIAK